jgi:toxic protein SymE
VPERRLTVSRLYRPKAGPSFWRPRGADVVPYVRLSGRWLEKLGFHPGERLRVEAAPGRLVLTPAVSASGVAEGPASSVVRCPLPVDREGVPREESRCGRLGQRATGSGKRVGGRRDG